MNNRMITRPAWRLARCLLLVAGLAIPVAATHAVPFEDITFHWDNTIDLSTQYGLRNASPAAAGYCALYAAQALTPETHDEGSCVYGAGFHSARVDFLPQRFPAIDYQ